MCALHDMILKCVWSPTMYLIPIIITTTAINAADAVATAIAADGDVDDDAAPEDDSIGVTTQSTSHVFTNLHSPQFPF